jgi:prenyltransferase beta subunit
MTMRKMSVFWAVVILVTLVGSVPVWAQADMDAALDYLKTQQNPDGGWGSGLGAESTAGSTADAVLAIVAAGGTLEEFAPEGNTPLDYLAHRSEDLDTAGDRAKVLMAVVAAGDDPRNFADVDLVLRLERLVGEDGRIGTEADTFYAHCLSVLALRSVSRPVPEASLELIRAGQISDGSWAWNGEPLEGTGDTNSTAVAVQALVAAGEPAASDVIQQALAYLEAVQNEDGGFPYQKPSDFGTDTDANSTAVVIQAILAAGQDPAGADWAADDGKTPVDALLALQNESGAFAWQATMPDDNLLSTVQALPAVAGKPLPLVVIEVPDREVASLPDTGAPGWAAALPLALAGLALLGSGLALARRSR